MIINRNDKKIKIRLNKKMKKSKHIITVFCIEKAVLFCLTVMRQITDLLTMIQDYPALAPNLPRVLDISYTESLDIHVSTHIILRYIIIKNPGIRG